MINFSRVVFAFARRLISFSAHGLTAFGAGGRQHDLGASDRLGLAAVVVDGLEQRDSNGWDKVVPPRDHGWVRGELGISSVNH
jgi:hypothetical protein